MKKYPYNMGSAIIYSVALIATLWWIPVIGPIITGYITGRKAGGPIKGLTAMAIPLILYFMIVNAIHRGLINIPPVVSTYLGGTILTSTVAIPFAHYIEKTAQVAMSVAVYLNHYIYYAPPSFFIMLSFAFIGGAVSRQVILERGIYKEKRAPYAKFLKKKETKEFEVEEESEEKPIPVRRRAPVEYNPYPQPQPMYAQPAKPHYPHTDPQDYPPNYGPQPYYAVPQPQQTNQPIWVQNGRFNDRESQPAPQSVPQELPRKTKRNTRRRPKRRKQIKPFEDERESKFVVHPMEQPKSVLIKKKSVNRDSSIAFL